MKNYPSNEEVAGAFQDGAPSGTNYGGTMWFVGDDIHSYNSHVGRRVDRELIVLDRFISYSQTTLAQIALFAYCRVRYLPEFPASTGPSKSLVKTLMSELSSARDDVIAKYGLHLPRRRSTIPKANSATVFAFEEAYRRISWALKFEIERGYPHKVAARHADKELATVATGIHEPAMTCVERGTFKFDGEVARHGVLI